jgi:hypothetical protein
MPQAQPWPRERGWNAELPERQIWNLSIRMAAEFFGLRIPIRWRNCDVLGETTIEYKH